MSSFSKNYLSGSSKKSQNINKIASGKYDLGIFLPSWDQRCLSIIEAKNVCFDDVIIVQFTKKDKFGYREKHDQSLLEFLTERSNKLHQIEGFSTDTDNLQKKITSTISQIYMKKKEALSLFYDLSTSPRFYALSVLSFITLKGLYKKISFFYAEGDYPKEESEEKRFESNFSRGAWKPVEIPYILGKRYPYKKTMILVSVGFEGIKTLQLVDSEEPDSVNVLFPGPGYNDEYNEVTYEFNRELLKQYKIDNSHIFKVYAGDAIEVWRKLEKSKFENPEDQNIIYLCCGTKPHALGMCLKAITSGYPIIKYRIPDEHVFVDIKPNGTFWNYTVNDLSVP